MSELLQYGSHAIMIVMTAICLFGIIVDDVSAVACLWMVAMILLAI